MWVRVKTAAPLLNTPDFRSVFGGRTGREIPTDEKGHCPFFEFVALPGMVLWVEEESSNSFVSRVSTPLYPCRSLYLDRRFAEPALKEEESRKPLPPKEVILKRMKDRLGTAYVWGGNWSMGIPEMLAYYPPQEALEESLQCLWTLRGVDCSGLLYEAAEGATPRNTRELLFFGQGLSIRPLCKEEILSLLQPLDMIIYPGHVLFVSDASHTIESKSPFGVIQRDVRERLSEILQTRIPEDQARSSLDPTSYFLIRRWPSQENFSPQFS